MTAFAGDNIWDFHDPDDDLAETFEGNIALQYAWKQLMGEKRSAKRIDEVNRHAAEKIVNWNRLGEKSFSGATKNAQNIATIGSLVGSGISMASPMLADKWGLTDGYQGYGPDVKGSDINPSTGKSFQHSVDQAISNYKPRVSVPTASTGQGAMDALNRWANF